VVSKAEIDVGGANLAFSTIKLCALTNCVGTYTIGSPDCQNIYTCGTP